MKIKNVLLIVLFLGLIFSKPVLAIGLISENSTIDSDGDGLSDYLEIETYKTNPANPDTDGDGYSDGDEIKYNFDPNKYFDDKLKKEIIVTLSDQTLRYRLGDYSIGSFKISSGKYKMPTPTGEFEVLKKIPKVNYKGVDYFYPNTRWNMMFKEQKAGNLYIHGAYWHNNFGIPVSHGCINVSYENIEKLYNWADIGTKITIKSAP